MSPNSLNYQEMNMDTVTGNRTRRRALEIATLPLLAVGFIASLTIAPVRQFASPVVSILPQFLNF
jgi:hypothetical protein